MGNPFRVVRVLAGAATVLVMVAALAAPAAAQTLPAPAVTAERVDRSGAMIRFTLGGTDPAGVTHWVVQCRAAGAPDGDISMGLGGKDRFATIALQADPPTLYACTSYYRNQSDTVRSASTVLSVYVGAAAAGDGWNDAVDNDAPADAVSVVRDYGTENAPVIIGVCGAIFLVGLTFYLVRRGLARARGTMRL